MDRMRLSRQQANLFSGIRRRNELFELELQGALKQELDSAEFIDGPALGAFEEEFGSFIGSAHCIGVANGLDALRLGLQALGVGPGDEVLVPAQTFVASLIAVQQVGATIVPVDVDVRTGLINLDDVPRSVTSRTRAIVAVHLHGRVVDIDGLKGLLGDSRIAIIEDAAQAHGATVGDSPRRAGSLGDLAAFSFYPTKNLGALGDGGAITTSRAEIADRVRQLSRYGDKLVVNESLSRTSSNSRLDSLQAAFLSIFLRHLTDWNSRRADLAKRYDEVLSSHGLPTDGPSNPGEVFHHYVMMHNARDQLAQELNAAGVPTLVHYPVPAYRHPALGHYEGPLMAGAEERAGRALSLPMHPWLNDELMARLCDALDRSLS